MRSDNMTGDENRRLPIPQREGERGIMRDSVVIIGSGLMGSGIAARSALAGNSVILVDTQASYAEKGMKNAWDCMEELEKNSLTDAGAVERGRRLLTFSGNMEEALSHASMVIEAVYENLELKQELFRQIDELLPPKVPIASNTSGLRITDIAKKVQHPERTMTTHFWFPAHLVPLVEVVMSEYTDEAMAVCVKEELLRWGKAPVLVKKDLPGQLANRILQAVIREAVNIVEIGLASPEDVDTAVKMGMGIRFPAWGPLEHIDAVGLDLCESVQQTVLPEISNRQEASGLFRKLVEEGNLGYKTGKGIYDWSVKDMDALAAGRNRFIIEALKILK